MAVPNSVWWTNWQTQFNSFFVILSDSEESSTSVFSSAVQVFQFLKDEHLEHPEHWQDTVTTCSINFLYQKKAAWIVITARKGGNKN